MLCQDPQEAARLAAELGELNRERQKIENEIWQEARRMLKGTVPDGPIVLASDEWHQGVVGIAASRLSEQYGVPTVMICLNGDRGKGSCRSCSGFNLYEALENCKDVLVQFGGHEGAAGLTIKEENIPEFRRRMELEAQRQMPMPSVQ